MRVVGVIYYKLFPEHPTLPYHSPALRTERMTYDRMTLNAWNALPLGMLHLAFRPSSSSLRSTGSAQIRHGRCSWGSRWGWRARYVAYHFGIGAFLPPPYLPLSRSFAGSALTVKDQDIREGNAQVQRPPSPETPLYMGQVGGILVLIGLFAPTFTTYVSVPWIVPKSNYCVHPILLRALVIYSELSAFEVSCFTFLMPATYLP
ncbi:hypothetical protein FIBSPDRAFT_322413 [Athelia psychrophila]|uniref:Uncharacterized protein n=1 Tax=Athelia psychrophila TaxID=1759441 RepID=A0A166QJZ4_9AGAM|nr:hypothetical protein FIBSPDRAFT_322413 [Fibularhizoctonia sp. CBS 109695]